MSDAQALTRFAERLRPHEASLGLALLELVRRADPQGVVDRGDWISAVRRAYALAMERVAGFGAGADPIPAEELPRYLQEHVLARLSAEGLAAAEPDAHDWDRVRFAPALWADLQPQRHEIASAL